MPHWLKVSSATGYIRYIAAPVTDLQHFENMFRPCIRTALQNASLALLYGYMFFLDVLSFQTQIKFE
jgi:hypothetical protein